MKFLLVTFTLVTVLHLNAKANLNYEIVKSYFDTAIHQDSLFISGHIFY